MSDRENQIECEFKSDFDHTCMNCVRKELSLLKDLDQQNLKLLERRRKLLKIKKGDAIFDKGSEPLGLLVLSGGKAKITRTMENGTEQIIALKKPVDFLGLRSLIRNKNHNTSAIALEDSQVCVIDKKDFLKVMGGNNKLAVNIIEMMATELDAADKRVEVLTQKQLHARLAEALLSVHDFYGTATEEDNRLNAELKRSDLASLSNMTTANVIRTLSFFADENVIRMDRRMIWITDLSALKKIAQRTDQG